MFWIPHYSTTMSTIKTQLLPHHNRHPTTACTNNYHHYLLQSTIHLRPPCRHLHTSNQPHQHHHHIDTTITQQPPPPPRQPPPCWFTTHHYINNSVPYFTAPTPNGNKDSVLLWIMHKHLEKATSAEYDEHLRIEILFFHYYFDVEKVVI